MTNPPPDVLATVINPPDQSFEMPENIVDRRLRYLRSGINADFTIACGDREWKVDKGILCAESEFFEKLCTGPFSVSHPAHSGKVCS